MLSKRIIIIFINILIFIALFFVLDNYIYIRESNKYPQWKAKKIYLFNNPPVREIDARYIGRSEFYNYHPAPHPPKINNKKIKTQITNNPVIIFGCSYAYGRKLNFNQTFGYKLEQLLKRPVINRAIPSGGLQHMYFLSTQNEFYENIPNTKDFIYVLMSDHQRRMLIYSFYPHLDFFMLHYGIKNNKFVMDNYQNPFKNFFKSLYTIKALNHSYVYYFLKNSENAEKITDIELLYFTETRKNLEQRYNHKINFTVIIYDIVPYQEILISKLKKSGFKVIDAKEITNGEILNKRYSIENDGHPNEAAWDLLTPLIAKKLIIK